MQASVQSQDSSSSSLVTTTTPSHAPLTSSCHGSRRIPGGNGNGHFSLPPPGSRGSPGSPGSPQPPPGDLRTTGALFQAQIVTEVQEHFEEASPSRRISDSSRPSMRVQEATTQSHSLELTERAQQSSRMRTHTETSGTGSGAITTSTQHTSPLGAVRPSNRRTGHFEPPLSNIDEPSQPSSVTMHSREQSGSTGQVTSGRRRDGGPLTAGAAAAAAASGGGNGPGGRAAAAMQRPRGDVVVDVRGVRTAPLHSTTETSAGESRSIRAAATVTGAMAAAARSSMQQGIAPSYANYMPSEREREHEPGPDESQSGSAGLMFLPPAPQRGGVDLPSHRSGSGGGTGGPPRAPSPSGRGSGAAAGSHSAVLQSSPLAKQRSPSPLAKQRSPSPPGPRVADMRQQASGAALAAAQRDQQSQQRTRLQAQQQAQQRRPAASLSPGRVRAPSPARDLPSVRPGSDAEPGPQTTPAGIRTLLGTPFRQTSHLRPQSPPEFEPPRQARTAASLMSPSRGAPSRSPSPGRGTSSSFQRIRSAASPPSAAAAAAAAAASVARSAVTAISPSATQAWPQPPQRSVSRTPEHSTPPEAAGSGQRGAGTASDVVSAREAAAAAKLQVDYEPPELETPRSRPKADKVKPPRRHKHIPMAANLGMRQSIYSPMPDSSSSGQVRILVGGFMRISYYLHACLDAVCMFGYRFPFVTPNNLPHKLTIVKNRQVF